VALFVLLLVGLVVAQTWLDWRDTRSRFRIPDWGKGMALASVVAILLASIASYASLWMEGSAQSATNADSQAFWPEAGLLLFAIPMIIAAARMKRRRSIFVLGVVIVAAFLVGIRLSH
jgi:hypothetical protein